MHRSLLGKPRLPAYPDLTIGNPGEYAVIVALQAVAMYPDPTDFVRTVQQRLPGTSALLQASAQPSGCELLIESVPTEATNNSETQLQLIADPSACSSAGPSDSSWRKNGNRRK